MSGGEAETREQRRGSGRRRSIAATGVVLALALAAAGGWAARALLKPPDALPAAPAYTIVTAADDSVSRSFSLNAGAAWSGGASFAGAASGTITKVHLKGGVSVKQGDPVYEVNLQPVIIAQGVVPAFRDLTIGTKGADVTQVQELLRSVKVRTTPATGTYDLATANQVYAWKKTLKLPRNGTVELGRIIFVPKLPARVALAPEVKVGAAAPVGATAVTVLPAEPTFTIALPSGQAAMSKAGQSATLRRNDAEWPAVITSLGQPGDDGTVQATLGPAKGKDSICGKDCNLIPIKGSSDLTVNVVVVPKVSGPTIPASALQVGPDAKTTVIDEAGNAIPVTVKASSGGLAVVDGLTVGTKIRAPQTES